MKKHLLISIVAATSLVAANNAQIESYFKSQVPPQVKVEVTDTQKVKQIPGFEFINIKLSDGEKSQNIQMFSKDGMLFPEIIDLKNQKSMRQTIEKQVMAKKIKALYDKEDKSNIISLKSDPKKETLVVFTDPECPYCRQELKGIESRLKTNNLKLLITPVHGESSLKKTHLIYKNIKNAKTNEEKIAVLRKYYNPDVNISNEKVSQAEVTTMDNLRNKYMGSVIQGVPFIISENELK